MLPADLAWQAVADIDGGLAVTLVSRVGIKGAETRVFAAVLRDLELGLARLLGVDHLHQVPP